MTADGTNPQAVGKEKQVHVTVDTEKGADIRVDTKQRKDRAASFDYVPNQKPTDWTAQALIGRTVENDRGDNLGDINNVIRNERGQVVAVTIGVGGFLGMGEKNVGVPFQALDFRLDTDRSDIDKRIEGPAEKKADREARFDTEHSNIQIVLNASKEQLEAAPEFVWLDQQNADNARNERTVQFPAGWHGCPAWDFLRGHARRVIISPRRNHRLERAAGVVPPSQKCCFGGTLSALDR